MKDYQTEALQGVSRTFALTIPQLPPPLRLVVTNFYLLCRMADTIEDDINLTLAQKTAYLEAFKAVVCEGKSSKSLSDDLYPRLSPATLPSERELIKNSELILACTRSLNLKQTAAIKRCITLMTENMPRLNAPRSGLKTTREMGDYCYFVAGVVGEALTELFCDYSPKMRENYTQLMEKSKSFGQGLQMTNILKDLWEDLERGVCWLPQDQFQFPLGELSKNNHPKAFQEGLHRLISIAHHHLHQALEYVLLIPKEEAGMRRFCLWSIGFALLTLKKISKNPGFTDSSQVKISRKSVQVSKTILSLSCRYDKALRWLFQQAI